MEEIVVKSKRYFDLTPYEGEIWKETAYHGYMISNYGRLKHLSYDQFIDRTTYTQVIHHKEHVLAPAANKQGYYHTRISVNRKLVDVRINRLVGLAFIPNPDNLPYINHKNEITGDDKVENLEWCDAVYNANYGTARERSTEGHRKKKIDKWYSIKQYSREGDLLNVYNCKGDLEKKGFTYQGVAKCCEHKNHTAYGFVWRYNDDPFSLIYKKRTVFERDETGHLKKRPVVQYDLQGNYIQEHTSMTCAAEYMGGNTTMIGYCCNGKTPSAYGYIWRKKGDEPPKPYKNKNERVVLQYTKEGDFVAKYPSLKAAATAVSDVKKWTSIWDCCNGELKSYLGYIWKYAE